MSIARQIITAIESGDITAIRVGEELRLLVDLYPVLILPADPFPRIQISSGRRGRNRVLFQNIAVTRSALGRCGGELSRRERADGGCPSLHNWLRAEFT